MKEFDFSKRMSYMQKTADIVDTLFSSMNDPECISFGGGAPAKEALPVDQVSRTKKKERQQAIAQGRVAK